MTFLTQPLSSDMLITAAHTSHNANNKVSDDRLNLTDCGLQDDDIGQLLLKVVVSGVRFREINLDSNHLTDAGAQHIAEFLEKSPTSVRVVSLTGNKRITRRGIDLIKRGLLRHQRVQRVEEDGHESENVVVLSGFALGHDFDVSGSATEVLRVALPIPIHGELKATTSEDIDAMTEKLRQIGFRYNIRQPSASSRQRTTAYSSKTRGTNSQNQPYPRGPVASSTMNSNRRASLPSSSFSKRGPAPTSTETSTSRRRSLPAVSTNRTIVNSQRQQIKQQQDLRFQSLEAAIRRASAPQLRQNRSRSSSTTIDSRPPPSRGTVSSSNKRTFGQTHINTIRGLRR
ncbi:hypothetical protein ON010_g13261 [Phytophthora cinnamomi]|nr:hypothetical protein ON010_g13261 [Phytophthora cinnamomi]